jgi:hypothetical protein
MKRHILTWMQKDATETIIGIETTPWTNRDRQCSLRDMQGNGSIVLR